MKFRAHIGLIVFVVFGSIGGSMVLPASAQAQSRVEAHTQAQAQVPADVPECPNLSLYCIQLIPTAAFEGARAHVELARPTSAFGVAVTRDGHQRYRIVLDVEGLPDPGSEGGKYVLWSMPLTLDPVQKLGFVTNGHFEFDEVAFNKFVLMVSLESDPNSITRTGPLVLRGRSPSSLLEPHDLFQVSAFMNAPEPGDDHDGMQDGDHNHTSSDWILPAMYPGVRMLDAMMRLRPSVSPWLPELNDQIRVAQPRQLLRLADGDSISLRAHPVYKIVNGQKIAMLGYNGQIPGPLLDVEQNVTIKVTFINDTPFPGTIHWHGLRHDNAFDGIPGVTQPAVMPGESFEYLVHFPDAGVYWYHPHVREDIQQDLGLYGNMMVRSPDHSFLSTVTKEEVIVLDDLTLSDGGNIPYGLEASNFSLMGRFGNVLLVNGEESIQLHAVQGDTLRLYVTNVSNTRTWNVSVETHSMQIMASDLSPFEWASWEESITIAPAERYIADLYLAQPGRFAITNKVQSLDHAAGVFFADVDTLGWLDVSPSNVLLPPIHTSKEREITLTRPDITEEMLAYGPKPPIHPDKEIDLFIRTEGLNPLVEWILRADQSYFQPVEWTGTMPFMDWSSTGQEVEWVIREPSTGKENMAINWEFERNTTEVVRINNRRDSQHAMQHPIHVHGQRFLVLSYNGRALENRVWKDTVLIPAGMTADILIDFTNPGKWMLHCHIAEHLESGMMAGFEVK